MNVHFTNKIPEIDGFYLFKFNDKAEFHLVSIKTLEDGTRVLQPDSSRIKAISLSSKHEEVFKYALFSEIIKII